MQFGTSRSELSEGDNFVSPELRLWHGSSSTMTTQRTYAMPAEILTADADTTVTGNEVIPLETLWPRSSPMPAFGIGLVVACLARYSPSGAIHWHTPEQEGRLIVAAVRVIDLPGLQGAAFVQYHD